MGADYLDFLVYNLFFPNVKGGRFAEVAPVTGVDESNTFFFEKFLDWSGVLVEPSVCALCELPANRPNSTAVHSAVCSASGTTFDAKDVDFFCSASRHPRACDKNRGDRPASDVVPCDTLTKLFASRGIDRLDLLCAKHLELEHVSSALEALNLRKIDVDVVLAEVRRDEDVRRLQDAGYATFALTQKDDGLRGYLADVVAWKPNKFGHMCARLDHAHSAIKAELDFIAYTNPFAKAKTPND